MIRSFHQEVIILMNPPVSLCFTFNYLKPLGGQFPGLLKHSARKSRVQPASFFQDSPMGGNVFFAGGAVFFGAPGTDPEEDAGGERAGQFDPSLAANHDRMACIVVTYPFGMDLI